jgi:hypothetical protein
MAIVVFTDTPQKLLDDLRRAIENATIETWERTPVGNLTLTAMRGRWKNKAWLRPSIEKNKVRFNIIRPKGGSVSKEVYAVYHGRFSQMLLMHFDSSISRIQLSALAGPSDLV